MDLIKTDKISIGYDKAILSDISFLIKKGQFWGVVGPNGAGKSTLIKTLLSIVPPTAGKVEFFDKKVKFGYVPQRDILPKHYPFSADKVILMGLYGEKGLTSKDKGKKVDKIMENVGIIHLKNRYFSNLSGGELQKVLIARALVGEPDILVLDEPTNGMDLPAETDILKLLKRFNVENGLTLMLISHNIEKVIDIVDNIMLINKDLSVFKAGKLEDMISSDTLSKLYGRAIGIYGTDYGKKVMVKGDK